MKWDYIVGNPPYNKGIVKRHHAIYYHYAINSLREGYIGFFLKCDTLLKPDGQLVFVTPGKYLSAPGCVAFRRHMLKRKLHVTSIGAGWDIWDGILVCETVVTHISKGTGVQMQQLRRSNLHMASGSSNVTTELLEFDAANHPNYIMPNFDNRATLKRYQQMAHNGFLVANTSAEVKDGSGPLADFKAQPQGDYTQPCLHKAGKHTVYLNRTTPTRDTWRVAIKKWFAEPKDFFIIPPGVEHDYTICGMVCDNKDDAEALLAYTQTELFKAFWDGLRFQRHSYVMINAIPRPSNDPA